MNVQNAYDNWSSQYDTNINKTRDLEALVLREMLVGINFDNCLEIGCGTGKNTAWLMTRAERITAVDLSAEMLAMARQKISASHVHFVQANILADWDFADAKYDLVSFSLVLEHIEDLEPIFNKISKIIATDGYVYIGELHPFKQYSGSKARFTTDEGEQVVSCFNHHLSDFTNAAAKQGLKIEQVKEYFDEGDRNSIPRILGLLLKTT
jgi:ubiquinone/menaquinone biosynthesis C-methylase UbiE